MWLAILDEYLMMALLTRSTVAQAFLEGERCSKYWHLWILNLVFPKKDIVGPEKVKMDKQLREALARTEAARASTAELDMSASPAVENTSGLVRFVVLALTTLLSYSFKCNPPKVFKKVLESTFEYLQSMGWTITEALLGRRILAALITKFTSHSKEMKRDLKQHSWSNLEVFCDFVEHYIFYTPLYPAHQPKPKSGTIGFHLSKSGCVESTLAKPLVEWLTTLQFDLNQAGQHSSDVDEGRLERVTNQENVKHALQFLNQFNVWCQALGETSKRKSEGFLAKLANPAFFDVLQHRKIHAHNSKKVLQDALGLALGEIRNQAYDDDLLLQYTISEDQSFAQIGFEKANSQLKAGLYVLKRAGAYLQKLVDAQRELTEKFDKATQNEMTKSFDEDGMRSYVDAMTTLQAIGASMNERMLIFTDEVERNVVQPMANFVKRGEKARKEVRSHYNNTMKKLDSDHHMVSKQLHECQKQWVDLAKAHMSAKKVKQKQIDKVQKLFRQYDQELECLRSRVAEHTEKHLPDMMLALQAIEMDRMGILQTCMTRYSDAYRQYQQPNQLSTHFDYSISVLDPQMAVNLFIVKTVKSEKDSGLGTDATIALAHLVNSGDMNLPLPVNEFEDDSWQKHTQAHTQLDQGTTRGFSSIFRRSKQHLTITRESCNGSITRNSSASGENSDCSTTVLDESSS